MTATDTGITTDNIARKSDLKQYSEAFLFPAVTTNYILDTTNGDISAAVAGTVFTILAAASGIPLSVPDFLTSTTANVATGHLLTIKYTGVNAQGEVITENVSHTDGGGTGSTVTSTKVFAQVTRIEVVSISGATSGDTLIVGPASTRCGLKHKIKKVTDVIRIVFLDDSAAALFVKTGTTTSVDLTNNAIVTTVAGGFAVPAIKDSLVVTYMATGPDGVGTGGQWNT